DEHIPIDLSRLQCRVQCFQDRLVLSGSRIDDDMQPPGLVSLSLMLEDNRSQPFQHVVRFFTYRFRFVLLPLNHPIPPSSASQIYLDRHSLAAHKALTKISTIASRFTRSSTIRYDSAPIRRSLAESDSAVSRSRHNAGKSS